MTILVKFPLGTFQTTNKLNHDFNYYYDMSKKDAVINQNSTDSSYKLFSLGIIIFGIIFAIVVTKIDSTIFPRTKYIFNPDGKFISNDIAYFRDIPCQNNLFRAYYIGYKYGIIKHKTDLLGAIILKWIKDELIQIEEIEKENSPSKEINLIILNQTDSLPITNKEELILFPILKEASIDGILENNEFEQWCTNNYNQISNWFDDIIKQEESKLIEEGKVILEIKSKLQRFRYKVYTFTSELKQEALELAGLKKFLLDYSLIKDREAIEVHLFEEYLIYAQMLGIAEKVAKQFGDIYPEVITQSHFSSYNNISLIHTYISSSISHANYANSRAQSYSSRGGGFSSSGGGSGSFGGGGGGGGFR